MTEDADCHGESLDDIATFLSGVRPAEAGGFAAGYVDLGDDLTTRSLRFCYGGRLRTLRGPGLGVTVDPRKIEKYGRKGKR